MPYLVRAEDTADFRAQIRGFQYEQFQLHDLVHPSIEAFRSPRDIRKSDPETFHLGINTHGAVRVEQLRQVAQVGPGEMIFYDSSHPFYSSTSDGGKLATGLTVSFPRGALPLPENVARRAICIPISVRSGIGRLLVRYLRELSVHGCGYDSTDLVRLSTVTLDLIAATLDRRETGPQSLLLARIFSFIQEHLGDTDLRPETVAAAHGISIRSLHRLLQPTGVGVAAWIRQGRLERCRRELADPALDTRPIASIGARWGYSDPAHFSRAFRTAYGMSPHEFRDGGRAGRSDVENARPSRLYRPTSGVI